MVPVLGWLLLKGRCRSCKEPIPIRYPLVEFAVGALFLILYFVELISAGVNIPVRAPNYYAGVVWIIFYTKWDLVALYLFHCFALCVLLSWALIDQDGHSVPRRAVIVCLLIQLGAVIWRPELLPVSSTLSNSLITALAGLMCASIISFLFGGLPGLPIVGVAFGWQAVLTITAGCLLLRAAIAGRFPAAATIRPSGWLFAAAFLHLLIWRPLHGLFGFIGDWSFALLR